MRISILPAAAAAALGVFALSATPARATVYTSDTLLDGATVDLSITTDGTLGALSQSDITAFDITVTDAAGTIEMTQANTGFLLAGNELSATASSLLFDFTGSGVLLFEYGGVGDGGPFWCMTSEGCWGGPNQALGVSTQFGEDPVEYVTESGVADVADAAVPEPASVAVMLAGLCGVGFAATRRARSRAALA
jgi:hypothetical protein